MVEYHLEEGQKLKMPYGEAVVHDQGDHYELEIEARPGGLVRVGPYLGRIVEITDRLFVVDFEHPFGGHELACECTATRVGESLDAAMDSASAGRDGSHKSE
jgi:FKBP-type peptidyl-prolyl cis-trans isomerase 2